jgi:hypothetical protein
MTLVAIGPLCNIFFITEWIVLKLKIRTNIKIRFKKKHVFTICPVVFDPGTQTCATELKIDYGLHSLSPHEERVRSEFEPAAGDR